MCDRSEVGLGPGSNSRKSKPEVVFGTTILSVAIFARDIFVPGSTSHCAWEYLSVVLGVPLSSPGERAPRCRRGRQTRLLDGRLLDGPQRTGLLDALLDPNRRHGEAAAAAGSRVGNSRVGYHPGAPSEALMLVSPAMATGQKPTTHRGGTAAKTGRQSSSSTR